MRLDPTELIREAGDENAMRELSRDVARTWFDEAQELLLDRGEAYGEWGGKSDSAEVHGVVQSGVPPTWTQGRWEFGFRHFAAPFFEFGTEPHTITPDPPTQMLKFPWPDMPSDMRESFKPMWEDPNHFLEEPEVLLPEVEHPGTPELRFLRDSRERVGGGPL